MSVVRIDLSISGAKTLLRVLDHVIGQATNTGSSTYGIDELCRRDCAARLRELRNCINLRIPKKYRI